MTIDLKPYELVAREKAASLLNKIPVQWRLIDVPSPEEQPNASLYADQFLNEEELNIINKSASELLKDQNEGKLKAVDIANAYCHRAAVVHQLTNCCTEIFFDYAQKSAIKLDEYYKKEGKLKGTLHGIPISLKDQINLPGIDTALGYVGPHINEDIQKKITRRKSLNDESLIATIIENEGAVFYVKTAVPMAMLAAETSSNLGVTRNGLDRRMSPGGSSGGEGALLGAKGSVIGIGTDIGGSIRGPSAFHGLYGLRACSNRFPYLNIANSYPNQIGVCSVVGPMCRFPNDVKLISEAIISHSLCPKDPRCLPVPWRENLFIEAKQKCDLNIGVLKWDGSVMPQAPIYTRLSDMCKILKSNHIQSQELDLKDISLDELAALLLDFYTADDFEEIKEFCSLSGEPLSELLQRSFKLKGKVDTCTEFFDGVRKKYEFQQKMDQWWDENYPDMDCFIMPGFSAPTWLLGDSNIIANSYTRAINVLDYTAITIPIDYINEEDRKWERSDFASDSDEVVWNYYDHSLMIGKPITLQIVCRRYEEEKAIAIAERLSGIFNFHKK